MAAATCAPVVPQHPAGFLLNNHHPTAYPEPAPSVQPTAPVAPKPQPSDPYYGHEETARLCGRFIRHVFNCPAETPSTALPPNSKPTETTISLPRFIAYAFHRTRLPTSVAFHALFLLSRLKARYSAASCAYGHRLFLTSYMLSSKVICDDTYSNKSWAIVGQGFYELRDVNLMEREMIHYLSFDLTISAGELEKFTQTVRQTYKRGVPRTPYPVVPDRSRENDYFGKGSLEIDTKLKPSAASKKSSDVPPKYVQAMPAPINTNFSMTPSPEDDSSPLTDSASTSSSRTTSPPSPCLRTPPDDVALGGPHKLGGKPGVYLSEPREVRVHLGTDSNHVSPITW